MKKLLVLIFAFALSVSLVSTASAFVWYESGDAGSLPATAQITSGAGSLTAISGTISPSTDVDMFRIYIPLGSAFSASTVGSASFDTQLFLFDYLGYGVYANDDAPSSLQSTLPADDPLSPSAAGYYYLAISSYNNDPVSSGGLIFGGATYTVGPTGPGGSSPITGWDGNCVADSYTICLAGAETVIPEPATLSLLGIGLLGLVGLRKKKRG